MVRFDVGVGAVWCGVVWCYLLARLICGWRYEGVRSRSMFCHSWEATTVTTTFSVINSAVTSCFGEAAFFEFALVFSPC